MKNTLFAVLTIFLFCSGGEAFAGSVTIPNTFNSGQPALASEVNSNFSALANEVNDNATNIATNSPMYVKHNDVVIGKLLDATYEAGKIKLVVVTNEGYLAEIANGDPMNMAFFENWEISQPNPMGMGNYYAVNDCSGDLYTNTMIPGTVVCEMGMPEDHCYYVDKTAVPVKQAFYQNVPPCEAVDPINLSGWYVPFKTNDVAVTGIPNNGVFTGPITISAQ